MRAENKKAGALCKSATGRGIDQQKQLTTARMCVASPGAVSRSRKIDDPAAMECIQHGKHVRQLFLFELNGAISEPYVFRKTKVMVREVEHVGRK